MGNKSKWTRAARWPDLRLRVGNRDFTSFPTRDHVPRGPVTGCLEFSGQIHLVHPRSRRRSRIRSPMMLVRLILEFCFGFNGLVRSRPVAHSRHVASDASAVKPDFVRSSFSSMSDWRFESSCNAARARRARRPWLQFVARFCESRMSESNRVARSSNPCAINSSERTVPSAVS